MPSQPFDVVVPTGVNVFVSDNISHNLTMRVQLDTAIPVTFGVLNSRR